MSNATQQAGDRSNDAFPVVWRLFFSMMMLLLVAAPPVGAADISGTAADATGAALVGAAITLQNVATGAEATTATDASGRYTFEPVSIGIYRVWVDASGFSQEARSVSIAEDGESVQVNFVLRVGGLTATVNVTAARSGRDTLVVPLRVESLEQDELQAGNFTSTGDTLTVTPGVTPVGSGPFQVRPRLRGLDSTRVLVLVDGERLNNARTATDRAGVEVGLVDPLSIERVEVVSGAGSVLYGTDALSGTINIITAQPQLSDALRFDAGFDGFYSSNENGRRGSVSLGASNSRAAFRFTGSLEEFDNYKAGGSFQEDTQPFFDSGTLKNVDTADQFGFRFRAFPDPFNQPFRRTSAEVSASGARGDSLNASGVVSLDKNNTLSVKYLRRHARDVGFPDFVTPSFFQRISLPFSTLDRLSMKYQARAITPWFSGLSATVYYQKQDRLLRNNFPVQFPAPTPVVFFPINIFRLQIQSDTEHTVTTPGVDVQATFLLKPSNVLTTGVTIFSDRSRDQRTTVTQTTMIGNVGLGQRGPQANVFQSPVQLGPPVESHPVRVPDSTFRDIGVFAQDEWDVNRYVRIVGGLRVDLYDVGTDPTPGYEVSSLLTGASPQIDPATMPDVNGVNVSRTAVTGEVGVVFRPTERISAIAHYGRSYRHPNLEELLFAGPATIGNIIPNIKVGPERGDNIDIGVKLRTPGYAASLSYFNNSYKGFISTEVVSTSTAGSLSQAINFADVRIQGLEGDGEVPFALHGVIVTPFGSFAYNRGEVLKGTNPLTGTSLDNTPQDNITPFKAVTGVRLADAKDRCWFEYSNRTQAKVNRIAPTLSDSPYLIAQDLLSLEGFTIHRMGWGVDWVRDTRRIGLSFAIENLGNKFYREQFQFAPARGRTFTIGVHARTF